MDNIDNQALYTQGNNYACEVKSFVSHTTITPVTFHVTMATEIATNILETESHSTQFTLEWPHFLIVYEQFKDFVCLSL